MSNITITIDKDGSYFLFGSKSIQNILIKDSEDNVILKININDSVPYKVSLLSGYKIEYPKHFLGFFKVLIDETGSGVGPSSVNSVNGKTGSVVLKSGDINLTSQINNKNNVQDILVDLDSREIGDGDFKSDGTVSMTGDLNFGSKKGINLLDPSEDNDASNKKYVDDKFKSIDTDNFLLKNGSIPLDTTYNPNNDYDIIYRKYMFDSIKTNVSTDFLEAKRAIADYYEIQNIGKVIRPSSVNTDTLDIGNKITTSVILTLPDNKVFINDPTVSDNQIATLVDIPNTDNFLQLGVPVDATSNFLVLTSSGIFNTTLTGNQIKVVSSGGDESIIGTGSLAMNSTGLGRITLNTASKALSFTTWDYSKTNQYKMETREMVDEVLPESYTDNTIVLNKDLTSYMKVNGSYELPANSGVYGLTFNELTNDYTNHIDAGKIEFIRRNDRSVLKCDTLLFYTGNPEYARFHLNSFNGNIFYKPDSSTTFKWRCDTREIEDTITNTTPNTIVLQKDLNKGALVSIPILATTIANGAIVNLNLGTPVLLLGDGVVGDYVSVVSNVIKTKTSKRVLNFSSSLLANYSSSNSSRNYRFLIRRPAVVTVAGTTANDVLNENTDVKLNTSNIADNEFTFASTYTNGSTDPFNVDGFVASIDNISGIDISTITTRTGYAKQSYIRIEFK